MMSLLAAAAFFTEMSLAEKHVNTHALREACKVVRDEAKRVLGTYEYGWEPLAADTVEHKKTGDSPGYETGEMRESIKYKITERPRHGVRAAGDVGSDEDKALWFELGTVKQPPRSFLYEAAVHKEQEIVKLVGDEVFLFLGTGRLRGRPVLHRYPDDEDLD